MLIGRLTRLLLEADCFFFPIIVVDFFFRGNLSCE